MRTVEVHTVIIQFYTGSILKLTVYGYFKNMGVAAMFTVD